MSVSLSQRPPDPYVTPCTKCEAYLLATPTLVESIADLIPEFDLTFTEILRAYLSRFHEAGHRIVDSTEGRA